MSVQCYTSQRKLPQVELRQRKAIQVNANPSQLAQLHAISNASLQRCTQAGTAEWGGGAIE